MGGLKQLKKEFLERWPFDKLSKMTIVEYTDTKRKDSFCYWLEHKTRDLGSIVGGSSYKFGVYKMSENSKTKSESNRDNDGVYAWHTKYGSSAPEAFNTVKNHILKIAEIAITGNLNELGSIDLGDAYKSKIAFMYGNYNIVNIFKKEALIFVAKSLYNVENVPHDYKGLNEFLLSKKGDKDYYDFSHELWKHYDENNSVKIEFEKWLKDNTKKGSNKKSSYIKSIDILITVFKVEVYTEKDMEVLNDLYEDLLENQKEVNGKYWYSKAKSYGKDGYYSAAIKKYIEFMNKDSISNKNTNNATMENTSKQQPLNQILFGPPGTGKTYNTINKAIAIASPNFDLKLDREKVKAEFDRLIKEKQIVFTTFHQSMSYEDFVEGIKPQTTNGRVTYDIEDGLFKQICEDAELYSEDKVITVSKKVDFDKRIKKLKDELEESENSEIKISMTKTSYHITSITDKHIKFRKSSGGTGHDLVIDTLRSISLGERELIGGLGAYYNYLIDYLNTYDIVDEIIENNKPYILIIDEINRGNVSQIFGELITLIEEDKRLGNKEALKVTLPYSKTEFGVPANLHIIGTMNTADRSIEALDTALRRRFTFEEMPPKPKLIETNGALKETNGVLTLSNGEKVSLNKILKTINNRIEQLIDKDHKIGHSYFLKVDSEKSLITTFQNNIIPLLEEYFYGDYGKIGLVLGNSFVVKKNENIKFSDFEYDTDIVEDLASKAVYKITDTSDWDFSKI